MSDTVPVFDTVLVANRGEIALRVVRTCREMGIRTVVVHSTADRDSLAVRAADVAVQIGPAQPRRSYLCAPAIIEAALATGAQAVHPGYGFLSEDPDFAEICAANGLVFVGPSPQVMARLGDKAVARAEMAAAGLPLLPGSRSAVDGLPEALQVAAEIGFPLIIKAVAGGGGRGMAVVRKPADLARAYRDTRAAARAVFGNGRVYLERYCERARHIEVQVLADNHGTVLHLGERDCSVQRRHQKLVEEAPAPTLPESLRARMAASAVAGARAAGYTGAGTFEFLVVDDQFYFMEINCRIQVEHPVTEMVTGVDLVREQLQIAAGQPLTLRQEDLRPTGVAIECRINAEDPARGFAPTPGLLEEFQAAAGPFTRVDTHAFPGWRITPDYDSLLAKVVVWAPDRAQALARMGRALSEFRVSGRGVRTTIPLLHQVLAHPEFAAATHSTSLLTMMGGGQPGSPTTAPAELFSPGFMQDPHPLLATLRDDAAVHPVMTPNGLRTWLVVRYEEARMLLNDPRLSKDMRVGRDLIPGNFVDPTKREEFLREEGSRRQFAHELSAHMLDSDPPDHSRLRRLVGKVFTARRVDNLRPRICQLVDELLDAGADVQGQVDLMDALAFPVPFSVICWLLGVPPGDRRSFRRWSNLLVSGEGTEEVRDASVAMVDYLRALIAEKRNRPAEDMLTALVQNTDNGDQLDETELMSMAFLLLVAGHETTVNLIGNGALALLTHPDQRALLAADPARWPSAVEEFLRFDGPVTNATWRFTTEDVVVGGITIPKGEFVTISLGAAGRDAARYDEPDRLDISRANAGGLAFGHGIHHCLGAPLARLEGEIVLSTLFQRFPRMRLAVPVENLRRRFSLMMRGLETLPVMLD